MGLSNSSHMKVQERQTILKEGLEVIPAPYQLQLAQRGADVWETLLCSMIPQQQKFSLD